jgi:hypothetical protein
MKKLYRFDASFGRMGDLRGLFVADDETDVKPAIGKRAYFGEVLGKHSEVWIDKLAPEHFEPLTDDAGFIAKFEEYGCASGFNPLHYIRCEECGEDLAPPYEPHDHESEGGAR